MTDNPPILLAEDDPSHVLLVRRFLAKGGLVNPVHAVSDGAEALAYLFGEGEYADRRRHPLPAAVITDLHLAGLGGMELLEGVRGHEDFADIPIVVMSGSTEGRDIEQVHELGAAAYLVKPIAFEALLDVLHDLGLPWALQRPAQSTTSTRESRT
ncbi:response regulator [Nocardioides gansuensis]|uniref:response regulator n=1 Tax=Nocardioides gansuensis TaxID=2138300 RepID=UPI0014027628|nr:response regulator [Nocardioides gansuensis]